MSKIKPLIEIELIVEPEPMFVIEPMAEIWGH